MSVKKYLQSANRGDFHYKCLETTDGYGMGGVGIEEVFYKDKCYGRITRCSGNEFECEIETEHEPLLVFGTRASRKNARVFSERVIMNDIADNKKNAYIQ